MTRGLARPFSGTQPPCSRVRQQEIGVAESADCIRYLYCDRSYLLATVLSRLQGHLAQIDNLQSRINLIAGMAVIISIGSTGF